MGRLSKIDLAYIAGFLDGDGSIMLQMHRRQAGKEALRVKTVICFYQDSRHHQDVEWIQKVLECGYVYKRCDHISELRIEGYGKVYQVLKALNPYLRFKQKQAELMLDLIPKLQQGVKSSIVDEIRKMRELNYVSHKRNTLEDVPVTTDI
ncbi:hypothetical protein C4544_04610 [candidate division WS5 bacterium]|uniref:Homing endonuclease LAGLIDADG domain-containing protein n=1 Tax=candidate division WS5 bacterium TaxID=2093353 RepID=A0A419DC92_9BACT|nr:MAG: hypothetical protein C4544_04610 [candidate division WS5 bacterium]